MNSFVASEKSTEKKAISDMVKEMSENDTSLSEILKVVRISQETRDASKHFEDKSRRVINSRDFRDDLNVVRRHK
jgi:hypothetical protein